jgi:hypothetical protein
MLVTDVLVCWTLESEAAQAVPIDAQTPFKAAESGGVPAYFR